MGISRSLPVSTITPVLPGTAVQQSIYTDAGFTAGDYVYRYNGNSVGASPYLTSNAPGPIIITTVIAGVKYNFNYGTASVSRSNIITPISLPTTYTLTTPIATSMGSTFLAQQSINATAVTWGPRCALLTNGTIVVLYQSAATTLSYKIYNTAGTALYSGDIATGLSLTGWANSSEGAFDVCGLNAGGFAVAYTSSTSTYINTYTSTATLILSSGALSPSGYIIGKICSSPGDILYTIGSNTITAASGQITIARYTSSLTVSANTTTFGANYYAAPKIVFTLSGYLGYAVDASSSCSYGLTFSNLYTNPLTNSTFTKGSYAKIGICPSLEDNGGVFTIAISGGGINVGYSYPSTAINNTSFSSDGLATGYGSAEIFPAYITVSGVNDGISNGFIAYYSGATAGSYLTKIGNLSSDRTTWTTGASSYTTPFTASSASSRTGATSVCPTGTASGFMCGFNSSNYSSFALSGDFTYALSGSATTTSNMQPNPTNGYALIGVATTTAAAGAYGNVVINGNVSLASTYGTSSTVNGFNFNPRNGSGFLGNKGYVVNRVVTLQGLE